MGDILLSTHIYHTYSSIVHPEAIIEIAYAHLPQWVKILDYTELAARSLAIHLIIYTVWDRNRTLFQCALTFSSIPELSRKAWQLVGGWSYWWERAAQAVDNVKVCQFQTIEPILQRRRWRRFLCRNQRTGNWRPNLSFVCRHRLEEQRQFPNRWLVGARLQVYRQISGQTKASFRFMGSAYTLLQKYV
jgi:hypothetical protein